MINLTRFLVAFFILQSNISFSKNNKQPKVTNFKKLSDENDLPPIGRSAFDNL